MGQAAGVLVDEALLEIVAATSSEAFGENVFVSVEGARELGGGGLVCNEQRFKANADAGPSLRSG